MSSRFRSMPQQRKLVLPRITVVGVDGYKAGQQIVAALAEYLKRNPGAAI